MSSRRTRLFAGGVAALMMGSILVLALPTQAALLNGATPVTNAPQQTDSTELDLKLRPQEASINPGGTITYAVVASGVNGGVGAYNITITIGDGSAADITAVELGGDPSLSTVTFGSNNDTVRIVAGLADTADTGNVTIANVTVVGDSDGATAVELTVTTIADEAGSAYTIGAVADANLVVGTPPTGTATSTAATTNPPDPTTTSDGTTEGTSPKTTSIPPTTTTGDSGPGFAVITTVIALLLGGLVAIRQS